MFHRSAFHSSRKRYAVFVSINSTRGAPSINQRPYTIWMPLSSIDSMVALSCGFVGVRASTSTAAYHDQLTSQEFPRHVSYRLPIERPDKGVAVSIFRCCDGSFRFDDGVNPTDLARSVLCLPECRMTYLDLRLQ